MMKYFYLTHIISSITRNQSGPVSYGKFPKAPGLRWFSVISMTHLGGSVTPPQINSQLNLQPHLTDLHISVHDF